MPSARRPPRLAVEPLEDRILPSVTIAASNNNGNGYAGLDFNQSGGYIPPDTVGAAGPSSYVESVNQTVAIYSPKATGATQISDSFGDFWYTQGKLPPTDPTSFLSDPIVVYDDQIGRFIVSDQDVDSNTLLSNFDFAVSKTNDPKSLTGADWNFYQISTTEVGFDADYPGNVGYNHDAYVFTLNMFGSSGIDHVLVTAVSASDLANGVASPKFTQTDFKGASLRPTTMHDAVAGDPMWLIQEHGDKTHIDVVKMSNPLGTPAFHTTTLAVTLYAKVVAPLNPDGSVITGSIDSRIQKSAENNHTIVAAQSVSNSARDRDMIQWYRIDVSSGTPVLRDQGRIDSGAGTYDVYPASDINSAGVIGMAYTRSGTDSSTDYMSAYLTGRTPSDAARTMQTPVLVPAGAGQANYSDFGQREGDLSGINVDPSDGSFWSAAEFANTEASANWGTAIANFTVSSSSTGSADLSVTDTGPATAVEGNNGTYTFVVTNHGPSAAPNVVLTDTLDPNSKYVSATTGKGTFTHAGGTVTFTVGTLAAGQAVKASVTVQYTEDGSQTNSATVTSSTGDPNPNNNTAAAPTTVSEPAISVSKPLNVTAHSVTNFTAGTFTHARGVEPASAFAATINWGDGTTSAGTVTLSGTTYIVKGSHTFVTPGAHTVSITVTETGNAPTRLPSSAAAGGAGPVPFDQPGAPGTAPGQPAATPPALSAAGSAGAGNGAAPQGGPRDEFLTTLSGGSGGSKKDGSGVPD